MALEGEAEFKAQLQQLNAEIRLHKSELEQVQAEYAGQLNSLEALQAKEAALGGQLDVVNQKYAAYKKMLEQSQDAQARYEKQVAELRAKLEALKTTTGATAEQKKALAKALSEAENRLQMATNSVVEYQKSVNYASRDQTRLNRELEEMRGYLREAQSSADRCAKSIDGLGKETKESDNEIDAMASALAALGVVRGIEETARAMRECVNASVDFESAMAGVQKVTKMSDEDLSAMGEGIKQLSTEIPATTTEIAAVAESAARLGIAREDVLSFSRVMLDLGESSNLSADEAATALARFANIVGTSAEDYERLGSTIVALGNNFATSEAEITAMASRLASAGTLAGLTEAEIMALAAAMSSVGIETEAGGTAMTQTLTAMEKAVTEGGPKLEEFARIAGMSSGEFAAAWQTEPIAAIQAFIAGLGGMDEAGESATAALDALGLSGVRQSNMLKALGLAAETLAGTVKTANTAWAENTELAATAAARYDTTEAKMQMAANAANNLKIAIGDALAPALKGIAEAGTAAFSWAAEFVEANPALVTAITGAITAVGLFAGGLTAYTVAAKAAKVATAALKAAADFTPFMLAVSAVSGLIVALSTYSATLEKVNAPVKELTASMEESRKAYEETGEAIEKESGDVVAMSDALERLAAVEDKSAAQKAAMADLVAELNEAVPGLTLAYDAQTDSLNMTGEAIRNVAQAEAERQLRQNDYDHLVQLYQDQADGARKLAKAENDLLEARERLNTLLEAGPVGQEMEVSAAEADVANLRKTVSDLKNSMESAQAEAAALEETFTETAGTVEDFSRTEKEAAQAAKEAAKDLKELREASGDLAGSVDTLAKALKEQAQDGDLSLKTALDLIDAGYGAALAIDTETGAVTLNRAAYVELATAKINDQIASLEVQTQAKRNAESLYEEATEASRAGSAYWDAAAGRAAALKAGDTTAIDAQIAALKQARAELQSFTGASETAGRASSSRAKKARTAAETDLAAFRDLRAELDHQRAMELVSERDYYVKLKDYRDQYLTDEGNLSEYRRVTEQIYKYDKALADSEAALWAEQTETLMDELESRVKGLENQRTGMEKALSGYGELFTVEDDRMSLESIQAQIDAIDRYEEALTGLRERGVGQDLLDEVLEMGVDEATEYARQLLDMSDTQWEQYNALWDEKQLRAAEVAEQFYKDQLETLETEYNARLGEALGTLTDTAFQSGSDTAKGLIEGLASQEEALYAKARAMEQEVARILEGAWKNIPSNAEIAASLDREAMRASQPVSKRDLQETGAAVVNGTQTAFTGMVSGAATGEGAVYLDGRQVGRIIYPALLAEKRANPEVVDDQ